MEIINIRDKIISINKYQIINIIRYYLINNNISIVFIYSLIIGFLYLFGFKTNDLQIWIHVNNDIYNWALNSLFIENIAHTKIYIDKFSTGIVEVFGSYIINYFYSFCIKKEIIKSEAYLLMTLATWSSVFIYYISRKYLENTIFISLLLGIGLLTSIIFNFIVYHGYLGQLIYTVALLCSISTILKFNVDTINKNFLIIFENYVPIAIIVSCYQSSLAVFVFITFLLQSFTLFNFNEFNINKIFKFYYIYLIVNKIYKNVITNLLIILLLLFITLPDFLVNSVSRLISVAKPGAMGWPLVLFNPLELINISFRHIFKDPNGSYLILNIIFILFIIILYHYCHKNMYKNLINFKNLDLNLCRSDFICDKNIKSIFYTWLVCYLTYLYLYLRLNAIYIVWKFATYTIIPLAFIIQMYILFFLNLLLYDKVNEYTKKCKRNISKLILSSSGIKITTIIVIIIIAIPSYRYSRHKSNDFVNSLNSYSSIIYESDYTILDIHNHNLLNLAFLSYYNYPLKLKISDNNYISGSSFAWFFDYNIINNINKILNSNVTILSDTLYSGSLINFCSESTKTNNYIIYYDKNYISKFGLLLYDGLELRNKSYYTTKEKIFLYVYQPENSFKNSSLLYFRVQINPLVENLSNQWQKVNIYIDNSKLMSTTLYSKLINYDIVIPLAKEFNTSRLLNIMIDIPYSFSLCKQNNTCDLPHADLNSYSLIIKDIQIIPIKQ
jgi:hypothetical protein